MNKFKFMLWVPFLLFLFSFSSLNTNADNNSNIIIHRVGKYSLSGNTGKDSSVSALGKTVQSNREGYFVISFNKRIIYGKLTKFSIYNKYLHKNVYMRLYNTDKVNIDTLHKAIQQSTRILSNKNRNNYLWQGYYDKKMKYYVVRPVNTKLQSKGFTGTGNSYIVYKSGILVNG